MLKNLHGKFIGLRRRKRNLYALFLKGGKHLRNAVVNHVLKDALRPEILAVILNRFRSLLIGEPVILFEGIRKRRADEYIQFAPVFYLDAEPFKGIHNGIRDSDARIGQRPVQVKQTVGIIHCAVSMLSFLIFPTTLSYRSSPKLVSSGSLSII